MQELIMVRKDVSVLIKGYANCIHSKSVLTKKEHTHPITIHKQ